MKKKFKLLTSIASLGLALAVMAFGVFAATAHQVDITSSIKFEANNVNVSISVVESAPAATIDYSGEAKTASVTTGDGLVELSEKAAMDDTKVKYGYQVTITNLGGTKVAFAVVVTPDNDSLTGVTVTVAPAYANTTLEAAGAAENKDKLVYTVEVTIDPNVAMDIAELDLSTQFTLTRVTAAA